MNQQLYNDLLNASCVLVAQKKNQDKIRELKERIILRNRIRDEMAALDDKPKGYRAKKGWGWFLLILGGIYTLVLVIVSTVWAFQGYLEEDASMLFGIPIFSTITCLGLLLIRAAHKSLKKHREYNKNLIEKLRQEDEIKNQADNAEITRLEKENTRLQSTGKAFVEILPTTYRNTEAACFLLLAVKDGRADSLKEGMNLYEEQLHRWKMEKILQNAVRMQQIQAEAMNSAMREIVSNQESINANLSSIAALQTIQIMQNNS